ncbi:MAG TPA: hypothetical protein VLG37_01320 [Candidatus Saccharimonadales bacterium]|nr:hypothetical protein [Candidatus Saccharimonadales bacterium]
MKFSIRQLKTKAAASRQRTLRNERQTPTAFSYYAQRSERGFNTGRGQQTPEEAKLARRGQLSFWLGRLGFLVGTIIILVCAFNVLRLSNMPRIIPVSSEVNRYFLHSTDDYQKAATKLLASSIWNSNKITVNTGQVSAELKTEFPELTDVSIVLPLLGHRPTIYLEPTQPALILNTSNGAFVLGQNGRALLNTSQLPASTKLELPVLNDQSGLLVRLGQTALPGSQVRFIQELLSQLQARKIGLTSFNITANELDVYLVGKPYFVKFNLHAASARQQAGTFLALQAYLDKKQITPAKYVDIRVDSRAYYQ